VLRINTVVLLCFDVTKACLMAARNLLFSALMPISLSLRNVHLLESVYRLNGTPEFSRNIAAQSF